MYKLIQLFTLFAFTQAQYVEDPILGDDDPVLVRFETADTGCPSTDNLRNITIRQILGQWHLPFMSSHWITYKAKPTHGKPKKRSNMGNFCVKVNVKELKFNEGNPYNKDATLRLQSKCSKNGEEWILACAPHELSNSVWTCNDLNGRDNFGDSYVYIMDTDGKTWALVARCFPGEALNWAIFSKVKKLENSLVKKLLGKIEALGLKIFNVVEVPYEKCMTNPE